MRTLLALSLTAILAVILTPPAGARDPEPFTYKWYKNDLYYKHYFCGGRYRAEGCDNWRWRRHYRRTRHVPYASGDALCHRMISATGGAAQSEESAKSRALLAWQAEVSFHFGDRYLSIERAKDATIACAQAGVPDTVGSKIQDMIGVGHVRCHVVARPCRVEARPLNKEED
jgi:hypothetical protein